MATGVAIIGGGIFARDYHLPAILSLPTLSLKAVYSRSLKSASTLTAHLEQKIDWYSDETADQGRGYDDLLTNTNIRGVIIALPILAQPDFIKKALAAGKHVLAEKPIAKDVATAQDLLKWYHSNIDTSRVTFSIAENWRFLESHVYAAEEIKKLGRILGFRSRLCFMIPKDQNYVNTDWRAKPEYQGGMLLDRGIHYVAATRLMLGSENRIRRIAAFTNQLQEHMIPLDTVNAIWNLENGVSGTFTVSFGTTFGDEGYSIACEDGVVTVVMLKVTTKKTNGEETVKHFENDDWAVRNEVEAWAQSLESGVQDPRLFAEEGLKDLELMEAMLNSGEKGGAAIELSLQQ